MSEDRAEQLKQAVAAKLKKEATKRIILWVAGAGAPVIGGGLIVVIGAIASTVLLAGIGNWLSNIFGPHPPAIATTMSRPAEWLLTTTKFTDQDGIPNVIALAVMEQASDGQVYGDRWYCSNGKTTGEACHTAYHRGMLGIGPKGVHHLGIGYGLMGLNGKDLTIPSGKHHSVAWNLSTGTTFLASNLQGTYWKADLTQFHAAVQTPPGWSASGNYADQIKQLVESYDAGPHLGAWALAMWSKKTGDWEDPGSPPQKEWVFAVGTAPDGATFRHKWKPHTLETIHTKKGTQTIIIHHYLSGTDVAPPVSVWGRTKSGQTTTFYLGPQDPHIPIWKGGSIWGAQFALTGPNALDQITAYWPNGQQDSIQWPENSGGAVATLTNIPPAHRISYWWSDIEKASSLTGVPADWIASEMSHESGGAQDAGSQGLAGAFGLMQLEPATAQGLPGWYPGGRQNPQENIILGAELLEENHASLGSWRLASAEYYGGLGNMEHGGFQPGMSWSTAENYLDVIPDASNGNTLTIAQYADNIAGTAQMIAKNPPK